ncbi:hypothetical protein BH09PAT1_BH09PAT1_4660 [soil metagenome]
MIKKDLKRIFEETAKHQQEHKCGSYPYESASLLPDLISHVKARRILELGTGLGYTASVMASSEKQVHIDTIDRDRQHMQMAKKNWEELGLSAQITDYLDKAEVVLPNLTGPYDLIFFDGHTPSMKFLMQFGRLLKKGGLLVTANMFLRDETGGKYLRQLRKYKKWQVDIVADTAIAKKFFE